MAYKEEGGTATYEQCRNGPKVTILSSDLICRYCSKDDTTGIYVWHQQTKRDVSKREHIATAIHRKASLLRADWNILNTTKLSGVDRLMSIQKSYSGYTKLNSVATHDCIFLLSVEGSAY